MKIIVDNVKFDYNIGCRLLKLKHKDCPIDALSDIWDDIVPMTFKEIAENIINLEQRRVAINCLGLDRLYDEVNPTLIKKQTITKQTTWVNSKGEIETLKFKDTYELYKVDGSMWTEGITLPTWQTPEDVYFVKFKDTSTDRHYMIWVDKRSVYQTNNKDWYDREKCQITPIQAIAWTIQTNIIKGGIEKLVRQGDCVLIKKKENAEVGSVRHLTEQEYRLLLEAES
jgi:hypothetical protein